MVNYKRKRTVNKNLRNSGLSFPLTCTKTLYHERFDMLILSNNIYFIKERRLLI